MRSSTLMTVIVVIVAVLLLAYGVSFTSAPDADVDTYTATLASANERAEIKTNILDLPIIKEVETLKVFGERPVAPRPENLNRGNPFGGI